VDSGLPQNWPEFLPAGSVDLEHAAGFGAEGWGDFHGPINAIRGAGGHIGLFPHGLAVSSVIVGFPSEFGPIAGAAPGVKILPVRVLDQFNFGWFSWFTAGILHVARLKADGVLTGPVVINFSIQAGGSSAILQNAIDYAISQGVIFVTIAGNFGPGPGTIAFPGRLPESITAGAVGWVGEFSSPQWFFSPVPPNDASQPYLAGFSGWEFPGDPPASRIDVVAPGSFVFGEWLFGPGFSEGREVAFDAVDNYLFGTSFACPHVVGVAAQMLQKNPHLNQADVETILRGTALALPGNLAATGKGLLRGAAAVVATPAP
jgi:subtilisin family serine protease